MVENKPMTPSRFWQEVYIAAVRSGKQASEARGIAQQALVDYQKLAGIGNG
jgi:hypothetical protein